MEYEHRTLDISKYGLTYVDEGHNDGRVAKFSDVVTVCFEYSDEEGEIDMEVSYIEDPETGVIMYEDPKYDGTVKGMPNALWEEISELLEEVVDELSAEPVEEVPGFGTMANFWKWKEGSKLRMYRSTQL